MSKLSSGAVVIGSARSGRLSASPSPNARLHHAIEHLDGCADVQEQQLLADLAEPVLLVVSQRVDGAQRAGLVRGH
jgi:hypothetical protein